MERSVSIQVLECLKGMLRILDPVNDKLTIELIKNKIYNIIQTL